MEFAKLKQSTQELYNDIDSCITNLINARTKKDVEGEGKALFRMEGLMVATLQQLSCIIDALPDEDKSIYIPSVWKNEDIKKSPSMCSWASIGDDGEFESGVAYYDADGHEISKEEYEDLLKTTQD